MFLLSVLMVKPILKVFLQLLPLLTRLPLLLPLLPLPPPPVPPPPVATKVLPLAAATPPVAAPVAAPVAVPAEVAQVLVVAMVPLEVVAAGLLVLAARMPARFPAPLMSAGSPSGHHP